MDWVYILIAFGLASAGVGLVIAGILITHTKWRKLK